MTCSGLQIARDNWKRPILRRLTPIFPRSETIVRRTPSLRSHFPISTRGKTPMRGHARVMTRRPRVVAKSRLANRCRRLCALAFIAAK